MIKDGREANLTDNACSSSRRLTAELAGVSDRSQARTRAQVARGCRIESLTGRQDVGGPRPVLIVKIDFVGVDSDGAPPPRDVHLVRATHEQLVDQQRDSEAGGEVTAVVILRDATPSHVVSCVRAAARGGPISPELLRQIRPLEEGSSPEASLELELTEREYDVLRMLADGESTRGIAEQLSYSERTVKNIVRDLLTKLNCKTRAHAVALAARHGVI